MPVDEKVRESIVASILQADPGIKLTWSKIVTMSRDLGIPRTRQWLCRDESIKKAYLDHKRIVSSSGLTHSLVDSEHKKEDLGSYKAEMERLKKTIKGYDERFIRWMANAAMFGLTVGQLDAPHYILDDQSNCESLNRPVRPS